MSGAKKEEEEAEAPKGCQICVRFVQELGKIDDGQEKNAIITVATITLCKRRVFGCVSVSVESGRRLNNPVEEIGEKKSLIPPAVVSLL